MVYCDTVSLHALLSPITASLTFRTVICNSCHHDTDKALTLALKYSMYVVSCGTDKIIVPLQCSTLG